MNLKKYGWLMQKHGIPSEEGDALEAVLERTVSDKVAGLVIDSNPAIAAAIANWNQDQTQLEWQVDRWIWTFAIATGVIRREEDKWIVVSNCRLPDAEITKERASSCGLGVTVHFGVPEIIPCFQSELITDARPEEGMEVAYTATYSPSKKNTVAYWTPLEVYKDHIKFMLSMWPRIFSE